MYKRQVGDVVEGEITNLADFGAFARIEAGIEGLVHISELSDEKIEHPREIVHRGQRVSVRIISIDSERQRIGLSMKRAPQPVTITIPPSVDTLEGGAAKPVSGPTSAHPRCFQRGCRAPASCCVTTARA